MKMTQAEHSIIQKKSAIKPKILHVIWDQKVGGVKSTLNGLINSDLAEDFDFHLLAIRQDKLLFRSLKLRPDVIIFHHPSRFKFIPNLFLLKQLNPQAKIIIHEHGYSSAYELFQVPSISQFHWMLKLSYGLCDRVVSISQAQAQWMVDQKLVNPEKLKMIRQCPPLSRFFSLTNKPRNQPFIFAAYGRFCLQKGFDILLQSLHCLPDLPIQVHLGGEGEQLPELKRIAQGLSQVKWLGRVDDVPSFLGGCDAVIIPSRWEPWGNVCIETKAAGKPVIASDVDGLHEQVQACGILVKPTDPLALSAAIRHFVELPQSQLEAWGRQGRESVLGSWERYQTEWRDFLWEVLGSS